MDINIKNTFTENLPADINTENHVRKVFESAYSFVNPTKTNNPKVIHIASDVANMLGFNNHFISSNAFLNYFSGNESIPNSKPYAMAYGGHQFGNWAGQLGDGRAINLGEVLDNNNNLQTLQLKGAGKTPYSRTADGFAVLRSSVREHLCSEAMHYLGIPTTRSLSLIATGNDVLRDVLYNGNTALEQGAIVCRVAPSFIRFGNFELFASRNDIKNLQLLVDYTVNTYFKEIKSKGKQKIIDFFEAVMSHSLNMVLHWQRVGFVHGVMNTDNMSIHGITIDYGPYGWMDNFDPAWTPNTTDAQNKRYRYDNQPTIVFWNLIQLANALFVLVNQTKPFQDLIDLYVIKFEDNIKKMWQQKMGLFAKNTANFELSTNLQKLLFETNVDMTIFFRNLANLSKNRFFKNQISDLDFIKDAFYNKQLMIDNCQKWSDWLIQYQMQLHIETMSDEQRKQKMNTINPKYVLRNYMAQLAIDQAKTGNYLLIDELHQLLKKPYDEQPNNEKWFSKRPNWALNKVGCSMLSCSS